MATPVFHERVADTARGRFAYYEAGEGPVHVWLLHGWPQTSTSWLPLAEHLDPRLHILIPDLRGVGGSVRTLEVDHYAKDELARDVLALADVLGLQLLSLVGHDWGGVIAQEMTLLQPLRIRRLALLNTLIIANTRGWQASITQNRHYVPIYSWYQGFMIAPGLAEVLVAGHERTFLDFFLRYPDGRPLPEAIMADAVANLASPGGITAAANLYRSLKTDIPRWRRLQGTRLSPPTLYLRGTLDPVITEAYLRGVDETFEDFRQTTFELGHFLHSENPAAVAEALSKFLALELKFSSPTGLG